VVAVIFGAIVGVADVFEIFVEVRIAELLVGFVKFRVPFPFTIHICVSHGSSKDEEGFVYTSKTM